MSVSLVAKPCEFSTLGVSLDLPPAVSWEQAEGRRIRLLHKGQPLRAAVYVVELGNLETFSQVHQAELNRQLARRLGGGAQVWTGRGDLGGRPGSILEVVGQRQGKPWKLIACWQLHGGQAHVLEVMGPTTHAAQLQQWFTALSRGWRWLQPDRG